MRTQHALVIILLMVIPANVTFLVTRNNGPLVVKVSIAGVVLVI
jgi:hypothetical protein